MNKTASEILSNFDASKTENTYSYYHEDTVLKAMEAYASQSPAGWVRKQDAIDVLTNYYLHGDGIGYSNSELSRITSCIDKIKALETPSHTEGEQGTENKFRNFLLWLGEQKEFQWDGEMWSENTGHDDFQEIPMVDMFDYWKENK